MALHPSHFVAVIGGAVAGSVAAAKLADRGIKVAVFEQNTRPYGKIEDGLPKWHVKLQAQEEGKIDERLSHPNIFFVPDTKLGRDIDFGDMVKNWGLSAILLANGAWRDRPLPIKGVDDFVGKGLIYQNPLVKWFNHYHESQYQGPSYHIPDDALIVGGGLASLDVVKIVMLETVQEALRKQGIDVDMLTLEHETIHKVLDDHKLSLAKLGLKGCRLYYRRRIKDMPLATVPPDATPERREKVYMAREKILRNFQEKFLFSMHECQAPSGVVTENGRLVGLKFKRTEIKNGRVKIKSDAEHEVRSSLVISSIGSIPEPVAGIDMEDELYALCNEETGQIGQFQNVFALGNVVTGKGNIKASLVHGQQVTSYVLDRFLAWREEDYQKMLDFSRQRTEKKTEKIVQFLADKKLTSAAQIQFLIEQIRGYQRKVGYANYPDWIREHRLESITDAIPPARPTHVETRASQPLS